MVSISPVSYTHLERTSFVKGIIAEVSEHMERAGIRAKVDGRVKHLFSIYKKMVNQNKTLDQIYDLSLIHILLVLVTRGCGGEYEKEVTQICFCLLYTSRCV